MEKYHSREVFFYARYEREVEKLNNNRDKRLKQIRFELIYEKPTTREAKRKNILAIYRKIEKLKEKSEISKQLEYAKNLKKFEKLLSRQAELKKVGGKIWCSYEQKLQELIQVL